LLDRAKVGKKEIRMTRIQMKRSANAFSFSLEMSQFTYPKSMIGAEAKE